MKTTISWLCCTLLYFNQVTVIDVLKLYISIQLIIWTYILFQKRIATYPENHECLRLGLGGITKQFGNCKYVLGADFSKSDADSGIELSGSSFSSSQIDNFLLNGDVAGASLLGLLMLSTKKSCFSYNKNISQISNINYLSMKKSGPTKKKFPFTSKSCRLLL